MIVITGGAGFVGLNIVKELNNRGVTNTVVVDDMTDGSKFRNLVNCKVADFIDATTFRESIRTKKFHHRPRVIFHYGAISNSETNGMKMLDANFTYSKELFQWCKNQGVRFIYASSAAVRPRSPSERLWILKDAVPNTVYQFYEKRKSFKAIELFGEYAGVEEGQQKRYIVHVEDVARLNCWFLDHPEISGIYNVGTGVASSFHDVSMEVAKNFGSPKGYIKFIPFPPELKGRYQSFTCADISKLRRAGFVLRFRSIKEGIKDYMEWLENNEGLDR
ncbi:NAD-dependent epimerase/dehydratase [Penicillium fimorum]|uniref:NAD-dependent epimerase/dehydratase n=1 Tax=Penicillium fimorum TaxID=1882269 RepID=A0A9W9Y4J8_9EURO|nr:NAD-dependent epimerase/dehydratase [Penicillium fimorum]